MNKKDVAEKIKRDLVILEGKLLNCGIFKLNCPVMGYEDEEVRELTRTYLNLLGTLSTDTSEEDYLYCIQRQKANDKIYELIKSKSEDLLKLNNNRHYKRMMDAFNNIIKIYDRYEYCIVKLRRQLDIIKLDDIIKFDITDNENEIDYIKIKPGFLHFITTHNGIKCTEVDTLDCNYKVVYKDMEELQEAKNKLMIMIEDIMQDVLKVYYSEYDYRDLTSGDSLYFENNGTEYVYVSPKQKIDIKLPEDTLDRVAKELKNWDKEIFSEEKISIKTLFFYDIRDIISNLISNITRENILSNKKDIKIVYGGAFLIKGDTKNDYTIRLDIGAKLLKSAEQCFF